MGQNLFTMASLLGARASSESKRYIVQANDKTTS